MMRAEARKRIQDKFNELDQIIVPTLDETIKHRILSVLLDCDYSASETAKLLDIHVTTIYRHMAKMRLPKKCKEYVRKAK